MILQEGRLQVILIINSLRDVIGTAVHPTFSHPATGT